MCKHTELVENFEAGHGNNLKMCSMFSNGICAILACMTCAAVMTKFVICVSSVAACTDSCQVSLVAGMEVHQSVVVTDSRHARYISLHCT